MTAKDVAENGEQFRAKLDAIIGQATSDEPAVAPDPVNQAMIRHWVDALGDTNPVYTDPEAAAASPFGEVVAPPTMLQVWTMGRPTIEGLAERGGIPPQTGENPLSILDDAGYTATVATNSEFEFDRYLRPGERIQGVNVIESISDEKTTALGVGYFVTWLTTFRTEDGEEVGRQRFRVLKFRPAMTTEGSS